MSRQRIVINSERALWLRALVRRPVMSREDLSMTVRQA